MDAPQNDMTKHFTSQTADNQYISVMGGVNQEADFTLERLCRIFSGGTAILTDGYAVSLFLCPQTN